MLYPELRLQVVSVERPAPPPDLGAAGDWKVLCSHPVEPRLCVAVGVPPDDLPHEMILPAQKPFPLPFPPGASLEYLGEEGLAVLVHDELTLFQHRFRDQPRQVQRIVGTYPGRLVEVVGDVLVVAAAEHPWSFFRFRDLSLTPLGEIGPDSFKVFDHFVSDGRLYLVGRGAGAEEQVVEPIFEPVVEAWPGSISAFEYAEAWWGVQGFPPAADRWTGTREYQGLVARALAGQGICLVTREDGLPLTLVLWFRDRSASVSLLAIPDSRIDSRARAALLALDGAQRLESESGQPVQRVLEPFWEFTVAQIGEAQEAPSPPERVAGWPTHLVRLRTP